MTIKHLGGIFGRNPTFNDVTVDGGIYFEDGQAGNLLDDYEEGTFTATLIGSSSPTPKVTTTATYTKIGRVVQFEIAFEGVDTTGYSGNLSLSGLPFTSVSRTPQSILTYNSAYWTGTPVPLVAPNNTIIQVFSIDSGGVWSWATHDAGTSRYINIAGSYMAA